MKLITPAVFVIAYSLASARGDLTIVQKVEGGGPVNQITVKMKGEKARIESAPQVTTILDSKTGEMLTLMNQDKKFMRISGDKAKAFAEMASKYATEPATTATKPNLTPTGKKESINGYETEEYAYDAPSFKASYWIAMKYPDGAAILKQLQAMTPAAWGAAVKGMPDFHDFPGLPLRTRMKIDGKDLITTLTAVKQDPLADSEFEVPSDFQEMKMPNIETMLGAKPSAAPSIKP